MGAAPCKESGYATKKIMQAVEFCLGRSRYETRLAPVKMDPLYEKALYSQEEGWTCEYALNTTAWD